MLFWCYLCKSHKEGDKFHKSRARSSGVNSRCIECAKVYQRKSELKNKYGLSLEEYFYLLSKQNNGCAICEQDVSESNKTFNVDHNHVTSKVRGILCSRCNRAIGLFKDDIEILEKAIKYLKCTNQE